jgi:hypothetical protein
MPVERTCRICGGTFFVPPSHGKQKHCSSKCYGVAQQGRNICKIEGCNNFALGLGLCNRHYLRLKRHGSPYLKKIELVIKAKETSRVKRIKVIALTCLQCGNKIEHPTYKRKYCSGKCAALANRKPFIIKKGYKKVLIPSHPRADGKGYVFEHIIIVESVLNRPIIKGEVCHHIDSNKLNNTPSNLCVFASNADHIKHHGSLIRSGENPSS